MKKYRTFLFIAGFAVLLLSQYKLVMPTIYKIAASDLFLVDSKDQASQVAITTPLSNIAFSHCNHYIKSELGEKTTIIFPEKPSNAWTLGNYQYLISADINVSPENGVTNTRKYACRITYNNGDNEEGSLDFDNWSIIGVSGIKDL